MNGFNFIQSKEAAYNFLDDFAFDQKQEISKRKLGKATGIIKSYILETESRDSGEINRNFLRTEMLTAFVQPQFAQQTAIHRYLLLMTEGDQRKS